MFWEKFYNLCEENNTKPNPVAKELGIASGTLTKWKSGTIPNGETLIKIANYFNCSIDNLLGRAIYTDTELTSTETKLINHFRSLSQDGKLKAIEYVSDLTENNKYKTARIAAKQNRTKPAVQNRKPRNT